MFRVGQQVTVNHPGESYDGEIVTVIQVCPSEPFPYQARTTPDADGETDFWFGADELKAIEQPAPEPILGIGGIGVFTENEMPTIPSSAALARMKRLQETDIICRRCGASKNLDGAMFTTDASSGLCDDCY